METALRRHRVLRACTWIGLVLVLGAWAASIVAQAPWTAWFTVALWGAISIGAAVRLVRGRARSSGLVGAGEELNRMYLGRTTSPSISGTAAESSEIGAPRRPGPTA